jgi:hypothetical protein
MRLCKHEQNVGFIALNSNSNATAPFMKTLSKLRPTLNQAREFRLSAVSGWGCRSSVASDPVRRNSVQGSGMRAGAGALLLLCAVVNHAPAGPTITLNYSGDMNGLQGVAVMQYEDLRLNVNPPGFLIIGNRIGWVRQVPLDGRIEIGGQLTSPTASFLLNATIEGTSDWGYGTLIPVDGSPSFQIQLGFESDSSFVYIDTFALTPNPLYPPQTTYYFQLFIPTPPPAPRLTGITFSSTSTPVIQWESTPSATYRLWSKNTLDGSQWILVGQLVASSNTASLEDAAAAGAAQRFYLLERDN